MKIWLDDRRDAPDDSWIVLRTGGALAGMLMVHDGEVEQVSFDHDLGEFYPVDADGCLVSGEDDPRFVEVREMTGYTYLCQIESMVFNKEIRHVPKLTVHSNNADGIRKMRLAIASIERMTQ